MTVAGPCEWCGGPQNWTTHAGEVLVRCVNGCLPLFEVVILSPPDCDDRAAWSNPQMEPWAGGGVVPLEGSDAKETDDDLPF